MSITFPSALLIAAVFHGLAGGLMIFYMPVERQKPVDLFFWGSILQAQDLVPDRKSVRSILFTDVSREVVSVQIDGFPRIWQGEFLPGKLVTLLKVSSGKPEPMKFSGPRVMPDQYKSVQEDVPLTDFDGDDQVLPRMRYKAE